MTYFVHEKKISELKQNLKEECVQVSSETYYKLNKTVPIRLQTVI